MSLEYNKQAYEYLMVTECGRALSQMHGSAARPLAGAEGNARLSAMTLAKPTFPAPDHDHGRCAADALTHAERVCAQRGQKFTPLRRQVLEALLSSHRPLGAYEIIEELAKVAPRPAPITVYRALEFLIANGLVHRIESRNAFLACAHDHEQTALVAFLICESCGAVGEVPAAPIAESLKSAAAASGFLPKMSVVEITGLCAHCQKAA